MAALASSPLSTKHSCPIASSGYGAARTVSGRLLLPPLLDAKGKPRHVSSISSPAKAIPSYHPLSTRHQSSVFEFGSTESSTSDSEILYFQRILAKIHSAVFSETSSTAMIGVFRVRDAMCYIKNDMVPALLHLMQDVDSPVDLVACAKKTLAKAHEILIAIEKDLPFDYSSMKAVASHFSHLEKIESIDAVLFDFLNQIREPLKTMSDDSMIPQAYIDNVLSILYKTLSLDEELFSALRKAHEGNLNYFDSEEMPNLEIAACRAYILCNKIFKELFAIADYTLKFASSKALKFPDHLEELLSKAKVSSEAVMSRYSEVLAGVKTTNPRAAAELAELDLMYQDLLSDAVGVED